MTTLLGRPLTDAESRWRSALAHVPLETLKRTVEHAGTPAFEARADFYAAALSLMEMPVASGWQHRLCQHLLLQPEFLAYVGEPGRFSDCDLPRIFQTLAEVDQRVDVKVANAMRWLHERNEGSDGETVVRLLGVLDRISPGRRIVMSIIHLLRAPQPGAASKAALFLGKRIQNPNWVDRQMASPDARVRANIIESVWGVHNANLRKCLREALSDEHNRVVGNALLGLHLLGDTSVAGQLRTMLRHSQPKFRATAAWVMGKTGAPEFRCDLNDALHDEHEMVRNSALRALALLPAEPPAPETVAVQSLVAAAEAAMPPALPAASPAPVSPAAGTELPEPEEPHANPARTFIPFLKRK